MYKYAKDGISVLITLDTRRSKKTGLYPIKIQVVFQRRQKYYPTSKELTEEEWSSLANTKSKYLIEIRKDIQNSFEIIRDAVQELIHEGGFSFDALNSRLNKSISDTLNTAFKAKIQALESNAQIGSSLYYTDALKSVEQFGGTNINFTSVDIDWLKKYEKYSLKVGRGYTTIGMYCRAIRCIINEARKNGVIKENQYPFGAGKYEIPTGQTRKLALTLHQIKKIVTYTDCLEATERYRDLWFFSYLCNGANFADILRLKYSNIHNGEISFLRGKTVRTSKVKKEVYALVTPEMQAIIDRWGNKEKNPESYIFPYIKGSETPLEEKNIIKSITKYCNKRMKVIGTALGIEGISTYTARHSYATVLKRSGANIAYISESLGHSDLKTTENYLASFEREERVKNAALLTNFGDDDK